MPNFNASEYTTVAERLTRAADQLQTIIAEPPVMLTDVMGYIRCTVALKDGRTSTGTASFRLDLTGGRAQATNPIEDCETSAIGRALGMLGYGSKNSIAGQEEITEAERRRGSNGATYDSPVPMCPEHNKPMKPGKDGKSFFCPVKHGEKWYSIEAEPHALTKHE